MAYKKIAARSLERVVEALCADYPRRKTAITEEILPLRVLVEYKFLNKKLLEGAVEIVGTAYAEEFIDDIGARRGYAKSSIDLFSEVRYKAVKAEIKLNIAKKHH